VADVSGLARPVDMRWSWLPGYAAWIAALLIVYYAEPTTRPEAWGLICLSGPGAVVAGLLVHRPVRKAPWLLLAAALACFAAGQMSFLATKQTGQSLPFPSYADGFYLACYPLYGAGLAGFIRWRSPQGDRRSLIDALTLTAGLALVSWTFLMAPYVHQPGLSFLGRATAIAYPVGDILMLALLARLLAPGTGGTRCMQLLSVGAASVLVSDSAYGMIEQHGVFANGGPVDIGWALFYAAWGAAALHPSMTRLTEPVPGQPATVSSLRLVVLMLASLIAPLVLLFALPGGPTAGVSVIAVLSAILYLLVLMRLWDAADSNRRTLARERVLRQEVIRQRSEDYFRTLVHDASDAIMIVDDGGTVRFATPSAAAIFGFGPPAGSCLWELVAADSRGVMASLYQALQQDPGRSPLHQQVTRQDGESVRLQARCSDRRSDPSVAGLVLTLRDVTEQHQLEEQLRYRAFHDALTGMPNRVLFQEQVTRTMAGARRAGTVAGVLFIDLDDFKLVNDTLGHAAGDQLLTGVARRLSALVRESDIAARLGGDEFALLVGDGADEEAVEAAAARVVSAFAEPFLTSEGPVTTSVTVGVATTRDSTDTGELLRHADLALYAAKAAGKRQWRRYRPVLSTGLTRRRELGDALKETVESAGWALAYQPIYELGSGKLTGFEALLRWPHPRWGTLLPGQFIGLAEETGQITEIGSWVLRRAAADLARWRAPGPDGALPAPRDLYVSVNVAARQLAEPEDFAGTVRRVLDSTGLAPGALVLELTETALLPHGKHLLGDLAALRSLGVRLAIDDFGTGYSSLSYLRELPVDLVKMDRSFVEGMQGSGRQLTLAAGIVHLASTLMFDVIAEGIETETQKDLLRSIGCRYGQGYLLDTPMPPDQAEHRARNGQTRPAPKARDES
jgi:diguanylate cyclase (GGDEF)-like protein/PAS domain S-box-containing protein